MIVGGLPPVDCKTVRYRKLPGFNFSPGLETLRRAISAILRGCLLALPPKRNQMVELHGMMQLKLRSMTVWLVQGPPGPSCFPNPLNYSPLRCLRIIISPAVSPELLIHSKKNQTAETYGSVSKPGTLVNIKIAGKWMFIPLKMVLIGIDPYPYHHILKLFIRRQAPNGYFGCVEKD